MATNGSPELLIVMGAGATSDQTEHVLARLQEAGVHARVTHGREATVIGAIGERELLATLPLEGYPGVEQVLPILKPYKLVAREVSPDPTVIEVDGRRVGDSWFGLIAGPCSVEYREQTLGTARGGGGGGRGGGRLWVRADRGPVLGRDRRADAGDGAGGRGGGGDDAARRRVQAANLAVHLPGPRGRGPRHPAGGRGGDRVAR